MQNIGKYVTMNSSILKNAIITVIILLGLTILVFIFQIRPSEKKFGGYLYPICENGLYGYIDSVGNRIIEPQFLWCSTFSNDKALVVIDTIFREVDDSISYLAGESKSIEKKYRLFAKYGYIDRSGKFVLSPNYICYANIANGNMNFDMTACDRIFSQFTFRNGRALAYDTITWKLGYINNEGIEVIPKRYYYAKPFSDSLAIVYEKMGKPLLCNNVQIVPGYMRAGYIDVNGVSIAECKFESLTTFNSKRGIGKITELTSLYDSIDSYSVHNIILNEKGEPIDTLSMLNRYYDYSYDGIAVSEQIMFLGINKKNEPSFGYINTNGDFLKPLEGLSKADQAYLGKRKDIVQVWPEDVAMIDVTYFDDGLAGVTPDKEHWYFIDKFLIIHGLCKEPTFEKITGFSNSLCAVKKNGKWGFVNRKIETIIPFKYDSCGVAYPYLEEAFALNSDGSIKKKYWINRFDSIVWESGEMKSITNKYSDKKKSNWGYWGHNDYDISNRIDLRYIYTLTILVVVILMVYVIYKRNYKKVILKKKYITIPIAICSLSVCLFCTHCILDYLLGDYINISKKSITKETANVKRKNYINCKCVKYEDEKFRSTDSIGKRTQEDTNWLQFGIGTLPYGKYLSTYVGTSTDCFFAGKKQVIKHSQRLVPKYKTINYGYGIKDTYQDGWKNEDYSYVDYEPIYYNYIWYYALSSFDISNKLSIFSNEDSVYSEYLKEIEKQLTANYGYKFSYAKVNGKKALSYTTYDGIPLKRVIFCANGRAYVMETKSIDKLNEHSEIACSKIILNSFNLADKDNRLIGCSIIGLLIGVILLTSTIVLHNGGKEIKNSNAHRFLQYSLLSIIINMILCCYAIYSMYVVFYISEIIAYLLILALSSCIIVIPLVAYYSYMEKCDIKDYIIPSWLNKYAYSKITSEYYKKLFLTFVVYPLMIGSIIPCGIITLVYSIPAILVSIIIIYVIKWINWLNASNKQKNNFGNKCKFKDYYSILNVPFDANQNDINIAYNSRMSFLNQFVSTKFDKDEYQDVQEAYRILSIPRIKSIYDNEYRKLSIKENRECKCFDNQELIVYIQNLRKRGVYRSIRIERFNILFFIIVVVITIIVFIVKFSFNESVSSSDERISPYDDIINTYDAEDFSY